MLILFKAYTNINIHKEKEEDKFYKELIEYQNILIKFVSIEQIKKINKILEIKFNFQNSNKERIYDFFILLNQFRNSINFIINKKSEEIHKLTDYLLDTGDIIINLEDIGHFIRSVEFFENEIMISNGNNFDSFTEFLKKIIEGINNNFKCGKSLLNYISKFEYINKLFISFKEHFEGFFGTIKNIISKSEFKISLNNNNIYTIEGFSYINHNKNQVKNYF